MTSRRPAPPRLISYALSEGWTALVGKTDEDNDRLSLSVARPDDLWFHVRGMPGSHVVLQGPPGEEPDRDTVKRAAAIAAYHSKARTGGVTPVSCTRARYVSKPRGAKPGTVEIRNEKVVKVRPATGEGSGPGKGKRETGNDADGAGRR
jgi:predicted ribosome quality control (RQC) complex YloA/Tae2 family protein